MSPTGIYTDNKLVLTEVTQILHILFEQRNMDCDAKSKKSAFLNISLISNTKYVLTSVLKGTNRSLNNQGIRHTLSNSRETQKYTRTK